MSTRLFALAVFSVATFYAVLLLGNHEVAKNPEGSARVLFSWTEDRTGQTYGMYHAFETEAECVEQRDRMLADFPNHPELSPYIAACLTPRRPL